MLWFLAIPVIGAVVAAVASSNEEDKKKAEREAQDSQRKSEVAKAHAIAKARQTELNKRKVQLLADAGEQLQALLLTHAAVLENQNASPPQPSYGALKAFADGKIPNKPSKLLKHLELVVPGVAFSSQWAARERKAKALEREIAAFGKLKEELLG
ncbi:hypothetical protein LVV83_21200 [Pseudomonas sp. LM20]|uniref:hypothetical protein n=1 Tax=Pseudomonas sp. LM20 TaxID=2899116 RepID=UPI001F1AEE47|nr:hypothetical protein [Pseudomonas sp. LM20]MCE5989550.1 hypothetical protein [Pseudomonas sp. LM20]